MAARNRGQLREEFIKRAPSSIGVSQEEAAQWFDANVATQEEGIAGMMGASFRDPRSGDMPRGFAENLVELFTGDERGGTSSPSAIERNKRRRREQGLPVY
jgi:hypothetical protein